MEWNQLTDLLSREYRLLRTQPALTRGFASDPLASVEQMRDAEAATAPKVDELIRAFARTGAWNPMSETENFFLRLRLRFAREYTEIARFTARTPWSIVNRPAQPDESTCLIEWALIDAWRLSGLVNLLLPIQRLIKSRSTTPDPKTLQLSLPA